MPESKSGALTSLATPQQYLGSHVFLRRATTYAVPHDSARAQNAGKGMAIQPPRDMPAHSRGHSGDDRARLRLGREFGKHTGAGPGQSGVAELREPRKMHCNNRVTPAHDWLEIVTSKARRKA